MIFEQISELVSSPDFTEAQMSFFEKHNQIFDENEEENKHEYKEIFELYLSLMEQLIESQLQQQY